MVLFASEQHLKMIPLGLKTETRREKKVMTPGREYPATRRMFVRKEDSIIIKCLREWREPVSVISKTSALNEGLYTPTMFKRLWKNKLKGNVNTLTWCYEFKFIRDNRNKQRRLEDFA